MTSNNDRPGGSHETHSSGTDNVDHELGDRISQAVAKLQDAMDAALLAGLIVEPNFKLVENRLTRFGTRIDSPVCSVRVYRKLT